LAAAMVAGGHFVEVPILKFSESLGHLLFKPFDLYVHLHATSHLRLPRNSRAQQADIAGELAVSLKRLPAAGHHCCVFRKTKNSCDASGGKSL
jgi:hypothetical protein